MCDKDIVRRAHAIAGIGRVSGPIKRQKEHYKDAWRWEVTASRDAYAVMIALYPLLGERRREQVRVMAQAWLGSHRLDQRTPIECLWDLVEKGPEHWIWRGHTIHNGYPTYTMPGTRSRDRRSPHRVIHELATGEPLGRRRLKNLCGTLSCVRPEHWTPERRAVYLEAEDAS
jgi:hypothetical protein